jgi:hypothetical protein
MNTIDNPTDYNLTIKLTKDMGYGVFATTDVKAGTIICPFVFKESDKTSIREFRDTYGYDNTFTYISYRGHWIINVKKNRNVVSYINERKDNPNVKLHRLQLIATQNINKDEQLFLKYWYKTNF